MPEPRTTQTVELTPMMQDTIIEALDQARHGWVWWTTSINASPNERLLAQMKIDLIDEAMAQIA